jgi:hypothetical protein
MNWVYLAQDSQWRNVEHGKELSDSIKGGESSLVTECECNSNLLLLFTNISTSGHFRRI